MPWWNLSKLLSTLMIHTLGDKETTTSTPPSMVILSIEEEVEVGEEEDG